MVASRRACVKWDATGMARSWRDPPPPFDGLDFTARRKLIDEKLTEFGYVQRVQGGTASPNNRRAFVQHG